MVTLKSVGDYVGLIAVAAGAGAIGGLGATFVPTTSPGVNSPRWLTGAIVGATAAVAILLVFPGTKDTTELINGKTVTSTTWSLLRIVPVGLIAGWAGPKVLAALQDRLLAAAKEVQLKATADVATAHLERIAGVAHATVSAQSDPATARALAPVVKSALEDEVENAKASINAAAGLATA